VFGRPADAVVGLRREDRDVVAERALGYPQLRMNPRPIRTAAEVREILELAW
jgi:hypothetical protein